ncbi:hypothetical protein GUJ93_ZPchr0013g37910 [Zizania palustris]|uniref:Uncharacterized protein n=1 Tax=Zizania palustris TaxID=103762 RepID=A0A8J5X1R6_ZIZPA|nr:hypothetical protein GUJ93_ZPchr0013g37910 [Zizania palustris]
MEGRDRAPVEVDRLELAGGDHGCRPAGLPAASPAGDVRAALRVVGSAGRGEKIWREECRGEISTGKPEEALLYAPADLISSWSSSSPLVAGLLLPPPPRVAVIWALGFGDESQL